MLKDPQEFILEELRDLRQELKRMNDTLTINTESLRTHIRRTELLEHSATKFDGRLSDLEVNKIKEEAVSAWLKSASIMSAKIIGGLVALATGLAMLPSFIQWLIR